MDGDDPRTEATETKLSRRGFVKATAAAGVGVAALSSATQGAAATGSRSSYTIMDGTADEQQVHVYDAPESGPTTLVVGGIHGDETAGCRAADEIATWEVTTGKLVVVPRAHPSAIADGERPWGSDDLNRHFPPNGGDCLSTLSLAIWNEVERHDPDLVLDLHSSRGIYESGDGGVGQALFPTSTAPARTNGETTVAALNDLFGLTGEMQYRMGNTLDADRDMLMHRVAGVLDRPGYIVETTEKAALADQVDWHLFAVEHAMAQFGHERGAPSTKTRHELVVGGTGTSVLYRAQVTEDIWAKDGTLESADSVDGTTAEGEISTQNDAYYFYGSLESFDVLEGDVSDVDVTVDGTAVTPTKLHEMTVTGSGPVTKFSFSVSDEIVGDADTWEDTDSVSTASASGQVSTGSDTYTYRGSLDSFAVTSGDSADITVVVDGSELDLGGSGPAFEARTLTVDDPWAAYDLANDYDAPRVFAPALTNVGPQPAHTRVRTVSSGGFEARVEEWSYQNGFHYPEETGLFVMDNGTYELDGGRKIEVGTVDVNHSFGSVSFESDFYHDPVVLAQSQTENGTDPIVTRMRNVSADGFEVRLQEEDGEENGGYHYPETVAYVAMAPGPGSMGNSPMEAGTKTVDHQWTRIEFDREYADPTFLADVQSFEGWNSVAVRYRNLTGTSVEVKVEEEKSDDQEQRHVDEDVGYLVVEG